MDVFVIDTGLDTSHIEFARLPGMHVRTVKNLFDAYSERPDSPSNNTDGEGHGTHVAGTVQYSTVQYSTVQYSTVQHSTVQYSTVQYSSTALLHAVRTVISRLQCPRLLSVCKVCSCYIPFVSSVSTLSCNLRYFHHFHNCRVPFF